MEGRLAKGLRLVKEQTKLSKIGGAQPRAYLIGTGPGDIEYLTLRAVRAIGACEVLLIDDLVNRQVLDFAKSDCKIIPVGKKPGRHSISQEVIEELFLSELKLGKIVGRLKGGDPFVFGRGGEEIQMLSQNEIPFEIISGITAGIAAPASIGIPITHRGVAQSATFITGHSCASADKQNWRALVESGTTLVIYMGIARISEICQTLQDCGMADSMPAAVIENGTLTSQRSLTSTLGALAKAVTEQGIAAPAIIIIGAVVSVAANTNPTFNHNFGANNLSVNNFNAKNSSANNQPTLEGLIR